MDLSVLPVDMEALDPGVVIAAVAVLVLLVVVAVLALGRRRARQSVLRERFGSEYLRTVDAVRSRRQAEEALARRIEQRGAYELRILDPEERDRLRARWDDAQTSFVDGPQSAARAALDLVVEAAAARGYADEGVERCLDDVSVDHPELVADLRRARSRVGAGPSTDRYREALLRARALFERLVAAGEAAAPVAPAPQFPEHDSLAPPADSDGTDEPEAEAATATAEPAPAAPQGPRTGISD